MRLLATVLASLALPAAALAQSSPFAPLPQSAPEPPPTVVVDRNANDGGGLAGWQEALILGSGLVLLVGIGYAIVADARSKAPVAEGELAHPGQPAPKRNRSAKQRERARAKAKVGRAQRRRNRRR